MLTFNIICSQDTFQTVEEQLDEIAEVKEGLKETTQLDVSGLTLFEIITSLAEEHKLNVDVDPGLNQLVVSNFYDVKVKDVFLFLIRKYELDVQFMNNIIVFKAKEIIQEQPKPKQKRKLDITYNEQNDFLSVKLKNDSLPAVAAMITELANKNIVLAPDTKIMNVSAYIINRPFDQVIDMIAKSNQLIAEKDENGFYFLSKDEIVQASANNNRNTNRRRTSSRNNQKNVSGDLDIKLNDNGYLAIKAFDANATEIITKAAEMLKIGYAMYDKPDEVVTTIFSEEMDFDTLLEHIFRGKKYTVKKSEDFYLIGKETTAGLRATELIQLENRTIESVLATLPKSLTQDVEIQEFVELNGMLVSGSKPVIIELKQVIRKLDKVVPLVQIEVLIVQYQKSYDIQTGIQAILGDGSEDVKTTGSVFPTTNVTLNSGSINQLIDAFNGLGVINIGKVTKNFYANLSALENNSVINLKSTPKIATLSGHEANVSIGETSYYFEQTNQLINRGVNDNIVQSGQWKPTEANLSVNIKPFVSLDEHVTLEISVEKSAFLARAGENAPPGKSTQKFESLIRIKNNEMILLGGLDELERENSGSGTPFLSRIPIIKWFFSSRRKAKDKSKLHVFIKPSVIY
ncbi:type II and III secretion system protein [Aquimarina sp. 2201CG5-10]|uniref:type II secretion system protein GspD n=1 Tax=Aquimarina callyspongiae TaxID=3098150 RepID=UPI002AB56C6C|nr:type II and III secretion system protein [Aquimarina sp. 2201CG5-10]MDY8138471.1 type II and III secretion system protein [Aquimarina sp. 2201CG5-10]